MGEHTGGEARGAIERVVTTILEGGIPQIIAGPAGKAISRLIGGAADIPAAWLEQKAQAIRDETNARSEAMKALGKAVGKTASQDPAIVDRGVDRLLGATYRKQMNREAVAVETIELLQQDPPTAASAGPDDDWLNVFETYAENATTDRLRNTWARVLAGEIRRQGSFSLSALQFVSILDQRLAVIVENVSSLTWGQGFFPVVGRWAGGEGLVDVGELGSLGFLVTDKLIHIKFDNQGHHIIDIGNHAVLIQSEPGGTLSVPVSILTHAGRQIASIAKRPVSFEEIRELSIELKRNIAARTVSIGRISDRSDVSFSSGNFFIIE